MSDVWAGWRGLTKQGHASSTLPTSWSAHDNIEWRTPIPGRGHSSPIVFGDRVYVSTAYDSDKSALQGLISLAVLVTGAIVFALTARVALWRCQRTRDGSLQSCALAASFIACAVILLGFIVVGESLLDFARCPIRSWLATSGFVTLCFCLALAGPVGASFRIVLGCAAALFAFEVVSGIPAKAHAFRGGIYTVNGQVVVAAAAMPLLLAAGAWFPVLPPPWRRRALKWRTIFVLVSGAAFIGRVITYRQGSLPAFDSLSPKLGSWPFAVAAPALVLGFVTWRLRQRAPLFARTAVVCAALSMVAAVVSVVDGVAAVSPYLSYHIGSPRPEPAYGWHALLFPGTLVVIDLARLVLRSRNLTIGCARTLLPFSALVLGSLFFGLHNYVAVKSRAVRALVSIDRSSGKVLWIAEGPSMAVEVQDRRNSLATPTPVTDSDHVGAYFGNAGIMCTDVDGKILWSRMDVGYDSYYGVGSSPVLRDGVLVISSDMPSGRIVVRALDANTGRDVWTREYIGTHTVSGNNRTPSLQDTPDGRIAVLLWGRDGIRALDLRTGTDLWRYSMKTEGDLVSSIVSDSNQLYLSWSGGTVALDQSRLAAASSNPVLWSSTQARSNCVSPVLCNGLLLTITDSGILTALDHQTGAVRWRHRLDGQFFSSPVAAYDTAYFTNSEGRTAVIACDEAFRLISDNDLTEPTMSSAAVADGRLYLRTDRSLFAIGHTRDAIVAKP